jgi:hypothetical protein
VRFDPKLIKPDDAPLDDAGDIELPDDLAELGVQLRDDAQFLSERYPATDFDVGRVSQPVAPATVGQVSLPVAARRRFWISVGAAAAVIVLALLATNRPTSAPPVDVADHSLDKVSVAPEATAAPVLSDTAGNESAEAATLSVPPVASPAVFLNGVSGPELEGLMDLWHNDGEQDLRIEI